MDHGPIIYRGPFSITGRIWTPYRKWNRGPFSIGGSYSIWHRHLWILCNGYATCPRVPWRLRVTDGRWTGSGRIWLISVDTIKCCFKTYNEIILFWSTLLRVLLSSRFYMVSITGLTGLSVIKCCTTNLRRPNWRRRKESKLITAQVTPHPFPSGLKLCSHFTNSFPD